MITKKQKRLSGIDSQLANTGLNRDDIRTISKIVDNQLIHTLEPDYMEGKFVNSICSGKVVAMRRTFGKNIVIYGPKGYALIEHDTVMYCFEYDKDYVQNTSFTKMTRGFTKSFVVYNNQTDLSLDKVG